MFDKNGFVVFENRENYLAHPLLQHRNDLHIIGGISSMSEYLYFTDEQLLSIAKIFPANVKDDDEETIRKLPTVNTILRNKSLSDKIKKLYSNSCQICGVRLKVNDGLYYSEVHHIVPLGSPHNGRDNIKNMICVCPNHHALLDLKAIAITPNLLMLLKHTISDEFINFHNLLVVLAAKTNGNV